VPATEEGEGFGVQRLDAQREGPDAEVPPGKDAFRSDVFGIGLQKDPGIFLEGQVDPGCFKDPAELLRRKGRRGAASEVDRVHAPEWLRVGRPHPDVPDQMIGESRPALRPAREDGEVAVRADGGAEGDVKVEAGMCLAVFPQPQELRNSSRSFICSADSDEARTRIRRSCSPTEYRC
jgi:hypothetical protein